MFELYQLRYFLAVVETGGFTRAARRERVAQPTLSAGIAKLESGLGVKLFNRSSRRVYLTDAGTRFLERARSILSQCQVAQEELATVSTPAVLRLGVLTTIPAALVRALVGDFLRGDQGTVIELFEGTEQELANRLETGRLDLALAIVRPANRARAQVLYREGYSLALREDAPLARKSEIEVTELAKEPTIVRRRCEVLSETSRFFTDHNVRPRLVYRTEQDERALAMVAAGVGFTVMPDHYQHQGVARRRLSGLDLSRTVGLVRCRVRGQAVPKEVLNDFVDFAGAQSWPTRT